MDINEYLDDSRRYNWLKKASKEQILLWMEAFGRSDESIDTALRASMVELKIKQLSRQLESYKQELQQLQSLVPNKKENSD
jgi:hypothetical protein